MDIEMLVRKEFPPELKVVASCLTTTNRAPSIMLSPDTERGLLDCFPTSSGFPFLLLPYQINSDFTDFAQPMFL